MLDLELATQALYLTSSCPSRDEDSFCKTAMSRREEIVSCIDVTIMDRLAYSALAGLRAGISRREIR